MADIIVRMAINPVGNGEIGSIATNNYELLNNISIKANSSGVFDVINDDSFKGTEMLAFNKGVLNFNKAGFLSNRKDGEAGRLQSSKKPRQYVWGTTDNNGYALDKNGNIVELVLTLQSTGSTVKFDSIIVTGDSIAKQFPIKAYLDDSTEPIYSDDAKWAIKFDTNSTTHTIRFTKWNRANYNAVLNSIRVMYKYINITNRNLQSLNSLSESSSDVSTINYGTIANSGNINIIDSNGEIQDLIEDGILPNSDVELDIQYNGNIIQHHITSDTDYRSNTKEFSLSLTNKMKDLDILIYKGYDYPSENRSLYDILFDVMKSLSGNILTENDFKKMVSNKCVYSDNELDLTVNNEMYIYEYLKNIIIHYPVIESGKTYREVIDGICTIAQLRMFINDNNDYEFISARPLSISDDKQVLIEPKIMNSEPSVDIIVKNKFKTVEIDEYEVKNEINYNINVGDMTTYPTLIYDDYNTNYQTFVGLTLSYKGSSRVESFYSIGSFEIPKKQNNNIVEILDVLNPEKNDSNKYSSNVSLNYVEKKSQEIEISNEQFDEFLSSSSFDIEKFKYTTKDGTGLISDPYHKLIVNYPVTAEFSTAQLEDKSFINFTEYDDKFVFNYKILTGKLEAEALKTISGGSSSIILKFTKTETTKMTISINGNKRVLSFNSVSASSPNIVTEKYKAVVSSNNLLQSGTTFNGEKISDVIKNNIINDYKNGIQSKQLDIICYNMKDLLGNEIINKNIGEILAPLNIITSKTDTYSDGTEKKWRIFSRDFIYDGYPYLKLKAEETLKVNLGGGLFDSNNNFIKSWSELIDDGDIVIGTSYDGPALTYVSKELTGSLFVDNSVSFAGGFENSKLTKVVLPNGVRRVGSFANSLISEISIPDTIESIESNYFDGCSNLSYNEYNNIYYLGNSKNKYLVAIKPKSTSIISCDINSSAKIISSYAFNNCDELMSVNIGESVINIGDYAFSNCDKLKTVNFEKTKKLNRIGSSAFSYCISISNIVIPNTVTEIGYSAFSGCSSLESAILGNSIKNIYDSTFRNCEKLNSIIIPNSVTRIYGSAFYNCVQLSSITIPIGVKNVDGFVFYGCNKLKTVEILGSLETINQSTFYGCSSLTSITIPDSVTSIYSYAFSGCSSLSSITIPSSTYKIEEYAFQNCSALSSAVFGTTTGWVVYKSGAEAVTTSVNLSNSSTNATYLKSTYVGYNFAR